MRVGGFWMIGLLGVTLVVGCTPRLSVYDQIVQSCGSEVGEDYERCADRVSAVEMVRRQQRLEASEALMGIGLRMMEGPPRTDVYVSPGW